MDVTTAALRGFVIGVSVAAPVGPIGVLCVRRTLIDGRAYGLAAGFGAATADLVYGTMAVLGLTAVAEVMVRSTQWLQSVGGMVLIVLGVIAFRSGPSGDVAPVARGSAASVYATTFGLTILNPMTVFSFLAVFASLGVGQQDDGYGSAATVAVGVFLGSAAWWIGLTLVVGAVRHRVSDRSMMRINRASGTILVVFGLAAVLTR